MTRVSPLVLAVVALVGAPRVLPAQGLIWSLPEDGAWVRYDGEYQQVLFDPTGTKKPTIEDATSSYACDGPELDFAEVICWRRSVEIKSVGREKGMFRGQEVDCRWIEIKTVTGEQSDAGIVPGPVGERIQKVLVPESEIRGATIDDADIPVAYLPIVKGFQKVGNAEPQPITTGVLQVYPVLTLVAQYRRVDPAPSAGDPGLRTVDAGQTTGLQGEIIVESKTDRSTNKATLWRSDTIPFGLAKWEVTLIREKKDATAGRDRFVPQTRLHVEMSATSTGTKATSEIVIPE